VSVLSLVLAMADHGVIGAKGKIPWHIPDDMRRFKAITLGKPVIMGRKTWQSLPRKPLPGRTNIVMTQDKNFEAPGVLVAHTLEEALALAGKEQPTEVMVIGGAEIYRNALPHAHRVYLTEVHGNFDGDTIMPKFDSAQWREVAREDHATSGGLSYSYVTLEKR
jgi:dihydrofolate reductase